MKRYTSIISGDHIIKGDTLAGGKERAKFAAYVQGNWDRYADGYAYGYPAGMIYNRFCADSIFSISTQYCGTVIDSISVLALSSDTACAGIYSIAPVDSLSVNYSLALNANFWKGTKNTTYSLTPIDMSKYAIAVIKAQTFSGQTIFKKYEYFPEKIQVAPNFVDFGLLQPGDSVTQAIILHNPTQINVIVFDIRLKFGRTEFTLDTSNLPITLLPGKDDSIMIKANAVKMGPPVKDSVTLSLNCYEKTLVELLFTTGEPIVWIFDASWGEIIVGNEEMRIVDIVNKSNVDVELYSIKWKDNVHFTMVEGLPFPSKLVIKANDITTFKVWYKPDKPDIIDIDTAFFTGNTQKDKLYSVWKGSSYWDVKENDIKNETVRLVLIPNPASDKLEILINIENTHPYQIKLYNMLGEEVVSTISETNKTELDLKGLPAGLYNLVVRAGKVNISKLVIIN